MNTDASQGKTKGQLARERLERMEGFKLDAVMKELQDDAPSSEDAETEDTLDDQKPDEPDSEQDEPTGEPLDTESALTALREENRKLKAAAEAAQGRVTPLQQELATSRLAIAEARRNQEAFEAQLKADKAEREKLLAEKAELEEALSANDDPLALLSDEERALLDPDQANVVAKLIRGEIKKALVKAEKRIADSETKAAEAARKAIEARDLDQDTKYKMTLAKEPAYAGLNFVMEAVKKSPDGDPELGKWMADTDEGGLANTCLTNFYYARGDAEIRRTARQLDKMIRMYPGFKAPEDSKKEHPEPDAQARIEAAMGRKRSNSGTAEFVALSQKVERLSRKANKTQAERDELKKLNKQMIDLASK